MEPSLEVVAVGSVKLVGGGTPASLLRRRADEPCVGSGQLFGGVVEDGDGLVLARCCSPDVGWPSPHPLRDSKKITWQA